MAEGRVRRFIPEDLSNVEFETSEEVQVVPTFDGMGLREDLLRGIYAYGEHGGQHSRIGASNHTYVHEDFVYTHFLLGPDAFLCSFVIFLKFCV